MLTSSVADLSPLPHGQVVLVIQRGQKQKVPLATLVGSGYSSETTKTRTLTPRIDYTSRAVFSTAKLSLTDALSLNKPEPTTQFVTPHSPTMAMLWAFIPPSI